MTKEEIKEKIYELEETLEEITGNVCNYPESVTGITNEGEEVGICGCDSCGEWLSVDAQLGDLEDKLKELNNGY